MHKRNRCCVIFQARPVIENIYTLFSSRMSSMWWFFSLHCIFLFCSNLVSLHILGVCIAKNQYWKLETNIPRKGIARPKSTFMCLWAIYIFPRSMCLFCCRKYVDRYWEYIKRLQTHECVNWDWGRAFPIKGILKWNFCCSVVTYPNKYMLQAAVLWIRKLVFRIQIRIQEAN